MLLNYLNFIWRFQCICCSIISLDHVFYMIRSDHIFYTERLVIWKFKINFVYYDPECSHRKVTDSEKINNSNKYCYSYNHVLLSGKSC